MVPNHRNIIGTEMEWAIMARLEGSNKFRPLNGEDGMPSAGPMVSPEYRPEGIISLPSSAFLSNGSRYYQDVGGHIEYATPENLSLDDVVLSELAGEWVAADSLRRFIASHATIEEAILYKRVIDDKGETWGYHVNISEDRQQLMPGQLPLTVSFNDHLAATTRPLLLHYATSLPMLGGGLVHPAKLANGPAYRYSFGQKVMDIQYDVSGSTTRNKPFISSRDESHANAEKYLRLHIVGTDPHISPWATRMMMGTTTLMLAGMKQGKVRELQYKYPVASPAAHIASLAKFDIEGQNKYEFIVDGRTKKYRDSDIQEMYIQDLEAVTDMSNDQAWAYAEWKRAVEDRRQDIMRLEDRSDAIAKLSLIQILNVKHGKELDVIDTDAANFDKLYTTVFHTTREAAQELDTHTLMAKTLPGKLRKSLFSATMPDGSDIDDRVVNPPRSTRAYKRGEIIRNAGNEKISSVNWGQYIVSRGTQTTVKFDPWDGAEDGEE